MRGATTFSLATALALLSATSDALDLVKRSAPAVVEFPIERKHVPNPVERDDARRRKRQDNTVSQVLDNEKTLYFSNITLGTPPQTLRTHIDTGSSDLWVNTPSSRICQARGSPCRPGGTYDPDESKTHEILSSDFNISYVDGSYAHGDYVTDTLGIGGITIEEFQFGTGTDSTSPQGVLGIGYTMNEVQVARNDRDPYPNLPAALVKDGHIKSNAYSLWLNDLSSNRGQIMFGGVNTGKYEGSLETLPILKRQGQYSELSIAMTGLGMRTGGETEEFGSSIFPIPALLDSGSSLTYLPKTVFSEIFRLMDGALDTLTGTAYVPCSLINSDAQLVFTFSEPSIAVDMTEMVLDLGSNPDGSTPSFQDGSRACVFGISPVTDHLPILGDTFLRSAYVVYDLENNEISLAKTSFNSTTDEVVEIGTGKNSVPDATGVADPVTSAERTGDSGSRLGAPTIEIDGPESTETDAAVPGSELPLGLIGGLLIAGIMFTAM